MKIASSTRSFRTKALKEGFTLIELLVVISIIAVLAGLLFPAMGAVRTMARKTSAKNDVTQIVNAVKMFYTEYGRYPVTAATGTGDQHKKFESDNGELMDILRLANTNDPLNTRKIRFIEIPNAKNGRSGLEISGTGSTAGPAVGANWLDPWGKPYQVFITQSYTLLGTISVTAYKKGDNTETKTYNVSSEVAAASGGNPEGSTGDPVLSFQ